MKELLSGIFLHGGRPSPPPTLQAHPYPTLPYPYLGLKGPKVSPPPLTLSQVTQAPPPLPQPRQHKLPLPLIWTTPG